MRRVLLAWFFVSAVVSSGCLTPDDKRQWQEAMRDLRGDNVKNIAPLSSQTPRPQPKTEE